MRPSRFVLQFLLLISAAANAQFPEPNGGDLERGVLPSHWATGGPKCMEIPEWQIHEYNPNLFILRQSGCTDTEMPFLYLFFGKERGLLWDTGSRNGNLVPALQHVVHDWLIRNHREVIPIIVTHSHSHGDHVFGDTAIQQLKDPAMPIVFVPPTVESAKTFFQIASWPEKLGEVDLGDRKLTIVPIPGHDVASIALYDRKTGILLSGDSLYPGRLYVRDFGAFEASTLRLTDFLRGKPVSYVLGNHIEETNTPYLDSPIGSIYHPQEHVLELTFGALLELEDALKSMQDKPRRMAMRDFTIWPLSPKDEGLGLRMEEIFQKTQEEQLKHKWDQTSP